MTRMTKFVISFSAFNSAEDVMSSRGKNKCILFYAYCNLFYNTLYVMDNIQSQAVIINLFVCASPSINPFSPSHFINL